MARAACKALVDQAADNDQEGSVGTRLLADVRHIFDERLVPFLPSADLVLSLRKIDEAPWGEERGEHELTARKLAARLKPFGVHSERDRTGSVRGYRRDAFKDAFARYLGDGPSGSVNPSETSDEQEQPSDASQAFDTSKCQADSSVKAETPDQELFLTDLTDTDASPPGNGQRPRQCPCGRPAPVDPETGLCQWCSLKASKQGGVS